MRNRFEDELFRKLASDLLAESKVSEAIDPDTRPTNDSIDAQVDDLLTNYVHDALISKLEGRDYGRFVRGMRLREDTKTFERPADGKRRTVDEIDVETLSDMLAKLFDNYENLLDIRGALIRRSLSHIGQKFDDQTVDSLVQTLSKRHGIDVNDPDNGDRDMNRPAPRAGFAGPMGSG